MRDLLLASPDRDLIPISCSEEPPTFLIPWEVGGPPWSQKPGHHPPHTHTHWAVGPAQGPASHACPPPISILCLLTVPAVRKEDQHPDPSALPNLSQPEHPSSQSGPGPLAQGCHCQPHSGRSHFLEINILCFGSLFLQERKVNKAPFHYMLSTAASGQHTFPRQSCWGGGSVTGEGGERPR